jgi:hypothetical protein
MLPREEAAEQEESTHEPVDHNHDIRKSTIEHDVNTSAKWPNDPTHRRGRPVMPELETDAARPRSVQ